MGTSGHLAPLPPNDGNELPRVGRGYTGGGRDPTLLFDNRYVSSWKDTFSRMEKGVRWIADVKAEQHSRFSSLIIVKCIYIYIFSECIFINGERNF